MRPIGFGCGCLLLHLPAGTSAFAQSIPGAPATASPIADAPRSSESACEQAGRQAERTHALPAGLLLAIRVGTELGSARPEIAQELLLTAKTCKLCPTAGWRSAT
jgi:hypothetical protein